MALPEGFRVDRVVDADGEDVLINLKLFPKVNHFCYTCYDEGDKMPKYAWSMGRKIRLERALKRNPAGIRGQYPSYVYFNKEAKKTAQVNIVGICSQCAR